MSQEDIQLIDLKDAVLNAFRPIEHLFRIMSKASLEDGGEMARHCAEVGLELARGFRVKLDVALNNLPMENHRD
jgi:hypothetical protein